jgi:hypothetical protein
MPPDDNSRPVTRDELTAVVDAVVGKHFRDAFGALMSSGMEPLMTGMAQLLNFRQRLVTMEESIGLLIESQARVERAVADATGGGDENEPWRQSLRDDDVALDDD